MNSRMKLVAAVLVACACLVAVLAASLTVLGSGLEGQERAVIEAILERRLGVVVMVVMFACVFLFLILRAVHEFLVLPPARAAVPEPAASRARAAGPGGPFFFPRPRRQASWESPIGRQRSRADRARAR